MAKALVQFLNQLSTNQVRTQNMFEMFVTSGYDDVDAVLENITMYGTGFTLPNRTLEHTEIAFKGYPVPVPTVTKMEQDHSLTVNADANGEIRRAFLAWQGHCSDPAISEGSVFTGDRRVNTNGIIRIQLLDNDMMTVSETYKMIGVRIASVGGLAVSNSDSSVSTFEVGFKSIYWEIEQGSIHAGAFTSQH